MIKKLFKNYESKRELREKIARLEGMLAVPATEIEMVERTVQVVTGKILIEDEMPQHVIDSYKIDCIMRMVRELKPLVEWDVEKTDDYLKGTLLVGRLYVATNKHIGRME